MEGFNFLQPAGLLLLGSSPEVTAQYQAGLFRLQQKEKLV